MDDLAREIQENVHEIENIPASELPQGVAWRICADCEQPFTASGGARYCPVCLRARKSDAGRKGGKARHQKTKPIETCLNKKKEEKAMPIETKVETMAPEMRKCAICGNKFLSTKDEPMCVQCRAEYAPAEPVETCLIGKPAYRVSAGAPIAAVDRPVGMAAQAIRRIVDAVATVERIADEWGVDVDTVIDTITEALGLARAVERRKSRTKDGAAE